MRRMRGRSRELDCDWRGLWHGGSIRGIHSSLLNPANDVVIVNTTGFEAHAFQVLMLQAAW